MDFNESPNLMDAQEVLETPSHILQSYAIPQGLASHSMAQGAVHTSMPHAAPVPAPMPSIIPNSVTSSRPPMRPTVVPHQYAPSSSVTPVATLDPSIAQGPFSGPRAPMSETPFGYVDPRSYPAITARPMPMHNSVRPGSAPLSCNNKTFLFPTS